MKSPNYLVRTGAERAAQNMPIQGTEADLMKRAMIELSHELPDEAEIIMQVHDSLIVEATEEKRDVVKDILKRVMEGIAPELKIKLSVDIKYGKNWGEI